MLCRISGETITQIRIESRKLELKDNKMWHDWVGKVIRWELWKWLKFDHTTKWFIDKPECVLENEMHKILWNYKMIL